MMLVTGVGVGGDAEADGIVTIHLLIEDDQEELEYSGTNKAAGNTRHQLAIATD
jgi:hypothetical protein